MTPDNAGYAVAAYTLATIVYLGYSIVVVVRERALRKRLAQLDGAPRR